MLCCSEDPQSEINYHKESRSSLYIILKKEGKQSSTRIKTNLLGAYSKLYQETIDNFKDVQTEIKGKMEGKVLRDAEIVLNRKIDPSERDQVLNDQNVIIS